MRRRLLPASWRIRLRAAAITADEALQAMDSYIAAKLDVRPLRSVLAEAITHWRARWRRHREAARVREYGPGRGLIAVVVNRHTPTTNTPNPHPKKEQSE